MSQNDNTTDHVDPRPEASEMVDQVDDGDTSAIVAQAKKDVFSDDRITIMNPIGKMPKAVESEFLTMGMIRYRDFIGYAFFASATSEFVGGCVLPASEKVTIQINNPSHAPLFKAFTGNGKLGNANVAVQTKSKDKDGRKYLCPLAINLIATQQPGAGAAHTESGTNVLEFATPESLEVPVYCFDVYGTQVSPFSWEKDNESHFANGLEDMDLPEGLTLVVGKTGTGKSELLKYIVPVLEPNAMIPYGERDKLYVCGANRDDSSPITYPKVTNHRLLLSEIIESLQSPGVCCIDSLRPLVYAGKGEAAMKFGLSSSSINFYEQLSTLGKVGRVAFLALTNPSADIQADEDAFVEGFAKLVESSADGVIIARGGNEVAPNQVYFSYDHTHRVGGTHSRETSFGFTANFSNNPNVTEEGEADSNSTDLAYTGIAVKTR
jgi:energy-coupling factor transporter ATP-binding protein EcfA2